jgi:hypothetical protein
MPLWKQLAAHAQSFVCWGKVRPYPFSPVKISQKCSQLIHMRFAPAFASGLETRNRLQNRQEKNEFYFFGRQKKFLDYKNQRRVSEGEQEIDYYSRLLRRVAAVGCAVAGVN